MHVSYWTMHFDASPTNQQGLHKLLKKDPRVIRATMLKLGEKIEDVAGTNRKFDQTIAFERASAKALKEEAPIQPVRY